MLAQVDPTGPGYDTWKIEQAPPGQPIVITPEMLEEAMQEGARSGCDCWIQPDGTYTLAMGPNDDGSSALLPLPFTFQLYGNNYTSCHINNNGNLTFNGAFGGFTAAGFPNGTNVMVAPFWADVDTRFGQGQVWRKVTPTALYVNWVNVGYYTAAGMPANNYLVNSFQVIITNGNDPVVPNGGNVSFCYGNMGWSTGNASGGVNGFGGTPATVGANRGDGVNYMQFGRFDQPGMAYDGPFGNNDGVDWLEDKHFIFSTDITTANVPPIAVSQSVCDSLVLCVGETATLEVTFLSPEPNQTTVANSTAPSLSNYQIVSNTSGVSAVIVTEFTPLPVDVGFHVVTFTATDNGNPVMTSTLEVVIEVQQGDVLPPGEVTLCATSAPVDLLPLLVGAPAGGTWTGPNGNNHSGTFNPATDTPGEYLYAYIVGTECASYGTVTTAVVTPANAGNNGNHTSCTTGPPVALFPLLGGNPDGGGVWLAPNGQPFTSNFFDPTVHPAGNYSYVAIGAFPCPNDTSTVSVVLQQAVDAGEDATLTVCVDAAPVDMLAALGGSPQAGGSWTGPNNNPSTGIFNAAADPVGAYTYLVSAVAPCPDQSAILTIATDPLPWAGNDGTVRRCADAAPVNLFTQLAGGPNNWGFWLDPDGNVYDGWMDPTAEPTGTHLYIVVGIGSCSHLIDTAAVEVVIDPLPEVSFTVEPLAGCDPLQVTITNTTPVEYLGVCQWVLGDGSATGGCDGTVHWYQDPGSYAINLTVTTPEGCTDNLLVPGAVLVEPAPEATYFFSPDPGTEFNNTVYFTADDPQAILFEWTVDGVPFGTGPSVQYSFPNVMGDDYEVCLFVEDRYGCTDRQCKTVPILVPLVAIPNAFTPDGDGLNDVFLPVTIDVDPKEHLFEVYDRWGQLVFSSTKVGEGWDGRHSSGGEILPQGVYVWRLTYLPAYTSDKIERRGTVTLIK